MAADIRRFLADEPIAAHADSFRYRAAKFVRRHRTGVALGGLAAVAALASVAAILWQAGEARRQRDAALAQLARATASSEFLGFLLSAAAPTGQKFVVADLLREGEEVVEKQFGKDDPAAGGAARRHRDAVPERAAVGEGAAGPRARGEGGEPVERPRPPGAGALSAGAGLRRGRRHETRRRADLPDDRRPSRRTPRTRWRAPNA